MPTYHPIFHTGENVSFRKEGNRVTIISTAFHHGGFVLHSLGKVDPSDDVEIPDGLVDESELIDTEFGWDKIDASSCFIIRPITRENRSYVSIVHQKTGIELLSMYQPFSEEAADNINEVAKVRDAKMFAERYGFSVHGLVL